ncbi:MAG: integrase [Hyphomicrobiales bacterium]|nr:MAG: integrase [Hyphomicrobiales bacterium]
MKIGYARVSTVGQNEAAQIDLLQKAGVNDGRLYIDRASGTNRDKRPELAHAISALRPGDSLVVTRLDRLARSVTDLFQIVTEIRANEADLIVTEQAIDTTSPTGKLMFTLLGAFAEFENDLRRERQAEGIAKAKAKGKYRGRQKSIDREAVVAAWQAGESPSAIAKRLGIARSGVYRIASEEQAKRPA